jgi:hypothetical protein
MTVGIDGTPPGWATCPECAAALECTSCEGAKLQGAAAPFEVALTVRYRCARGHERTFTLPEGRQPPESAQCPDCDGMLLPRDARSAAVHAAG